MIYRKAPRCLSPSPYSLQITSPLQLASGIMLNLTRKAHSILSSHVVGQPDPLLPRQIAWASQPYSCLEVPNTTCPRHPPTTCLCLFLRLLFYFMLPFNVNFIRTWESFNPPRNLFIHAEFSNGGITDRIREVFLWRRWSQGQEAPLLNPTCSPIH